MYKNVLVALDGSEQSYKALEHAVAIAEKFGSELTILTIVPKIVFPIFPNEHFGFPKTDIKSIFQAQEGLKAFHQDILTDAEATVKSEHANLNVDTILREGRPSVNIVDVAEKEGCDLIVMESSGIGGLKGRIFGSTSRRVAASCRKPIMIIT